MKIESGRNVSAPSGARPSGAAAAAPGFSPSAEAPRQAAATAPAGAIASLDAILALQTEEPLAQRRARQAKRGRDALDVLEKLEAGLLSGRAPASLRGDIEALQRDSEPTGDQGLDDILREIDIRLAVEGAKLDRLAGRA